MNNDQLKASIKESAVGYEANEVKQTSNSQAQTGLDKCKKTKKSAKERLKK